MSSTSPNPGGRPSLGRSAFIKLGLRPELLEQLDQARSDTGESRPAYLERVLLEHFRETANDPL